jgi:hypothetical protein
MNTSNRRLATLAPCVLGFLTLHCPAQVPPNLDPSQVVSGITAAGHYDYTTRDGAEHQGTIFNNVDSKTGSGVIFTIPDNGPVTTTLVSPGLSVTY